MTVIRPPATLGILGGGQLGLFFVQAAHQLGYRVWVLDPDPGSPAGRQADRHLAVAYTDEAALDELAATCAAITTEFENVPAATLEYLGRRRPVHPSASAVSVCQDRIAEKTFLARHSLPVGPWLAVQAATDLDGAAATLFPGVLKTARLGYDGKGQVRVANRGEAVLAFQQLGSTPCVLEALLPLDAEISVVLARGADGETQVFPVAENQHRQGILDVSIVPARVAAGLADEARAAAKRIAAGLSYVGTLAVEFFVSGGRLLVNEMAPRPHNSGHYTLDACRVSQYEQQVRGLCRLPLGDPAPHGSAVMVNLLGDVWFDGARQREPDWARLHAVPGLHLHLYGKTEPRPGRKMGHFTVVGPEPAAVLERALTARRDVGISDS
jgi:5-(carboxyamino)imidazole ribonucleotide synthase